jgi:hypothetical protein
MAGVSAPRNARDPWGTHHRLFVEDHALERAHRGGRGGELGEDEEGLALHARALERDDIEDGAVGGEERVELRAELLLGDAVVQVLHV